MTGRGLRLRRHHRPADLVEILGPHEPQSTFIVGNLLQRGSTRRVKAWVLEEGDDSTPLAVLLLGNVCPTRWYAAPFLIDGRDDVARIVAASIDRSSAWAVTGPALHVAPLLPHLSRHLSATKMPFLQLPPPVTPPTTTEERTRIGRPDDLDQLVELYGAYEHIQLIPTLRWVRRFLETLVGRGHVVIAEEEGRVAGAVYMEVLSKRYSLWNGLSVDPRFRGRGLSWDLRIRIVAIAAQLGVGLIGVVNPNNPMRIDKVRDLRPELAMEQWIWARLRPPHRYPGHWTIRGLWVSLNGPPTSPRARTGGQRDDVEYLR